MPDFLKKRPMLLAALAVSAVSVISLYSETALFVLSLGILALIFYLFYKRVKGELIFAAFLILAVTVSAFLTAGKARTLEGYNGSDCTGEFIVSEEPQNHGDYYSATLETVKSDMLKSGEKLAVIYYEDDLKYAERVKARISLKVSQEAVYKRMDYSNGVFVRGYIKELERTGKSDGVLSVVSSIRGYIRKTVFGNYSQSAATVMALVAGDKSYLSDEFYSNVKGAGVAHVMVVSGMHLSVIVSLFLYLINKLLYNRFLKAVIILFVTISVMAVCGFTMSIIRAGITYIIVALGLVLDRENTPENTLGFAVVIILLINPFAIFNVAFLLSVLSTFAILVVAMPVTEFLSQKRIIKSKLLLGILSSVIISISTLIFTAPVTVWIFGYLSTVSVITNLLIATPASGVMIFCILGFAFPFMDNVLFGASNIIADFVNKVINYFGSLSFSTVEMPKWTAIIFVVLILIILYVLLACKVRLNMLKLNEANLKRIKEGGNLINGIRFGTSPKKRN